jgi:putative Holliday junction resolvase
LGTPRPNTGRTLAIDIGDVRCGLALSNVEGTTARPLDVLSTKELLADNRALRTLVADYEVATIVVGLPLTLEGTEGPQARHVRALADKILTGLDALPLVFFDERYSSVVAKEQGRASGLSERDMRGATDSRAAAVFLQTYLDK